MRFRLFLLLCLFCGGLMAQTAITDSTRSKIAQAIENEYPGAKIKNMEASGDNYLATAKIEGQYTRVLISPAFEWIETRYPTSEQELPGKISSYLGTHYPTYEIATSEYMESKNNGAYYFLQIKNKGAADPAAEFFFDVSGNFMKKNEYFPLSQAISTSVQQDAERKAKQEIEKKAYEEARAKLLAMDRNLREEALPKKVKDNFKKKFPKVEAVKWDSLDNLYSAHFSMEEMPVKADFALNGDWVSTIENPLQGEIAQPVDFYISQNYPGMKLKLAERITRRDKNNSFYIELIPKKKSINPPVTQLYFDKNGKFEKAVEPQTALINAGEEVDAGIDPKEIRDERLNKKIDQGKEDDNDLSGVSEMKVEASELPSSISKYVSENYPDLKIKEGIFGNFPEGDNTYKVIISKPGVAQKTSNLFFTDKGKLISAEIEPTRPIIKVKEAVQAPSNENIEIKAEKQGSKKDVPGASQGIKGKAQEKAVIDSGDEEDVPELVRKNFKRKFPNAAQSFWTVEDSSCKVEFLVNELKNTVLFASKGDIQVTRSEMDPERLIRPIYDYIEGNFKAYKIRYAEKVTLKNRKNYYYVEIFSKKKNANPPEAQLYFDISGKYVSDIPGL